MDYAVKVVIFLPFLGFVYFVTDYFLSILRNTFSDVLGLGNVTSMMCQFGVFQGFTNFFTILVVGFAFRQVLNFAK